MSGHDTHYVVIARLDPAISIVVAKPCQLNRDERDKPGHDRPLFDIVEKIERAGRRQTWCEDLARQT
jgi:hypothetical protein